MTERRPAKDDEKNTKTSAETATQARKQAKLPNSTVVWFIVMLWPPVALIALAVLSVVVNYILTPPDSWTGTLHAEPDWVEPTNILINSAAALAFIGMVLNFIIGISLYVKKSGRPGSFF